LRARPCPEGLAVVSVLFLTAACATPRASGARFETVETSALPHADKVLVLEPPSYGRDLQRRYPVLYFLHEIWGGAGSLESQGVAAELTTRMADGRLPEFFVIAPSAPTSWFSDSYDGKHRYEQFLTGDLPRAIEARYRVLSGPASRGITGISMGGYGAVKIALKHPGLFGSVSALSGALIPFGWEDLQRYSWIARWSLKRVFGGDRNHNSLAENDVWEILRHAHFRESPFQACLRAGTQDDYRLDRVALQFGAFLNDHGVDTTVVLEPGRHAWSYWRAAVLEIAEWHGKQFSYDR